MRRCSLRFAEGTATSAFLVNINVLGAYVEFDVMLPLGQPLRCAFRLPGSERELEIEAVVAWNNPRQQHPVHSLPPGFGISFRNLSPEVRAAIHALVAGYETGLR
ncbi:MAG TPA: PilZ domain-containing protein [Vicinamibacteria bacterium]